STARHVLLAINRFLTVSSCFFQDLAHFASHVLGLLLLVANQDLANSEQNLGAARCGRMPPMIESFGRRRNCLVNILFSRTRKSANHIARVRRIPVLKPLVASARRPAAVDEIMICLRA